MLIPPIAARTPVASWSSSAIYWGSSQPMLSAFVTTIMLTDHGLAENVSLCILFVHTKQKPSLLQLAGIQVFVDTCQCWPCYDTLRAVPLFADHLGVDCKCQLWTGPEHFKWLRHKPLAEWC